jgi:hypothetical protein
MGLVVTGLSGPEAAEDCGLGTESKGQGMGGRQLATLTPARASFH